MSSDRQAPLIGITCDAEPRRRGDYSDYLLVCDHRYSLAVKQAGGHPVLLPIAHRRDVVRRYLEGIDGLVIVGGDDLDPALYGERAHPRTRVAMRQRTTFESTLYAMGRRRRLPMLGICYGMQLINVLEGGTLHQHLYPKRGAGRVLHIGKKEPTHRVALLPGTRLREVLRSAHAQVVTGHHQAVRDLAPGFVVAAEAGDGVIEAIEHPLHPELLAVQWHPEWQPRSIVTRRLFASFVRACKRFRRHHR